MFSADQPFFGNARGGHTIAEGKETKPLRLRPKASRTQRVLRPAPVELHQLVLAKSKTPDGVLGIRSEPRARKWDLLPHQIKCFGLNGAVKIFIGGYLNKKWVPHSSVVLTNSTRGFGIRPKASGSTRKVILYQTRHFGANRDDEIFICVFQEC